MLKLFRKTRRRLLTGSRLGKYVAYAVGEIFLVVVGILLALQIDAWNQAYQDRSTEKDYLINLVEDLKADTAWINWYVIDRYDRKVNALHKVRAYYQGAYEIGDTLAFLDEVGYGAVFGNVVFSFNRGVYDELVSTGNLRKIRSIRLRDEINAYYASQDRLKVSAKDFLSGYVDYINSLRPFGRTDASEIDPFDRRLILAHLRKEEFYRTCNLELTLAHTVKSYVNESKQDAVALIRSIEAETK
jgi:hypothetical protein